MSTVLQAALKEAQQKQLSNLSRLRTSVTFHRRVSIFGHALACIAYRPHPAVVRGVPLTYAPSARRRGFSGYFILKKWLNEPMLNMCSPDAAIDALAKLDPRYKHLKLHVDILNALQQVHDNPTTWGMLNWTDLIDLTKPLKRNTLVASLQSAAYALQVNSSVFNTYYTEIHKPEPALLYNIMPLSTSLMHCGDQRDPTSLASLIDQLMKEFHDDCIAVEYGDKSITKNKENTDAVR